MDATCTIQDSIHVFRLIHKYVSRILGTYHAWSFGKFLFTQVSRRCIIIDADIWLGICNLYYERGTYEQKEVELWTIVFRYLFFCVLNYTICNYTLWDV